MKRRSKLTALAAGGLLLGAALTAAVASDYDNAVPLGKPCRYEGKAYAHGSQVCQDGEQMKCVDGEWKDLGQKCQ